MTKKILSLLVCLSLLLSMLVLPSFAEEAAPEVEAAPVAQEEFEIVAEWIHGSDVYALGADTIVDRCAKNGITDIYLLVKGTGGTLGYNKTQFTAAQTREDVDVLQETIDAGHAAGIRVHAWLVTVQDSLYKANNPDSGLWHYKRARDNDNIAPYDEGYQAYMAAIATEIATNYEIDGIHLDYIRYNHLCNGWSEQDFANLEAMGANVENVKYLINKTFYADLLPEGEEADAQYVFNAYRNGDADALLIAEYRRNNVMALGHAIVDAAKAVNPDLIISGALMPEGGVTEGNNDIAFADLHYGQNYDDAVELYDYVCPMAYTGSYAEGSPEWFAGIAKVAMEKGNKVVMGLQSYYPAKSGNLMAEIEAVRALLPNEDMLGIVHFRHTQFGYAKFTYNYTDGDMDLDVINTNATGYKWIIVEAAEGVKLTGATYGEGFNAEAPVTVAEDGSTITLGYAEDAEEWLMEGLAEGTVNITFEGQPTDPNARIAIARIYITNESRAYNSYNREFNVDFVDFDGAVIDSQKVLAGEAAKKPANPLRPGYRFRGWDVAFDCITADLTVTATYSEIPQTQVYSELGIVGEWIHGSTVYDIGADTIVDRCAKNGITDIYLLVKGTGGKLSQLKTKYTDALTRTDRDVLQETLDAAHAVGIRVHAWLCCVQDELYKANNPEAGLWHYVRARDNSNITPYNAEYQAYMADVAAELATNYDIDGLHFDYIRYNHLANGWSEQDFANLAAMGADVNRVRYLINKTLYQNKLPEGDTVDGQYIFNAYRNGDKDALLIAEYRRANVMSLGRAIVDAAKAINPDLIISGALMPEGGVALGTNNNDVAFADLHYGQNYEDALEIYDYICPMAYSGDYGQDAAWVAGIAKYAAELGNKVVMGLQSYYPSVSAGLMAEIQAVEDLLPNENILGIVHFRHTQFGYAKFNYDRNAGEMEIETINTSGYAYQWVKIELAEGLKATAASFGEGYDAEAPVIIAEDGSYVLFGYDSEDDDENDGTILAALAEGTLNITFEGEQTNPDEKIALARIYNINETRSYNVYNDVTEGPWVNPFIDVKEDDWFYGNVEYAYKNGIMVGVSENEFDPNGVTTRAMIVATLYRIAGAPSVEGMENPFVDVADDAWYHDAVVWGYANDVVAGTSATTFEPDANVTREQVAAFLCRYAKGEATEEALAAFPDADKVTPYAREAMAWAVENGIISGSLEDGVAYLNPQGMATRTQTAAILSRYMQK